MLQCMWRPAGSRPLRWWPLAVMRADEDDAVWLQAIDRDGEVVHTRNGPKAHPALRDELAGRAFIVRTLERLGLNVETIKPMGRPSKGWKYHGNE
jgi:hypothetical protein